MARNLKVGDKLRHPGYSKDHTLTVMGILLLATSSTDVNHVNEWEQIANRLGATFKIVKIWSEEVEVPEEE